MIDLWRGSLVVAVAFLGAAVATASVLWWAGLLPSLALSENAGEYCNVLKVPVYGTIVTIRPASSFAPAPSEDDPGLFPEPDTAFSISTEIEEMLRSARADPSIKALLVDVESGGGVAVAGTEIASAIRRFGKPPGGCHPRRRRLGGLPRGRRRRRGLRLREFRRRLYRRLELVYRHIGEEQAGRRHVPPVEFGSVQGHLQSGQASDGRRACAHHARRERLARQFRARRRPLPRDARRERRGVRRRLDPARASGARCRPH